MTDNSAIVLLPKAAPAGHGASWLIDSFGFFKQNWLAWIGVTIIFFIMAVVVSIIPLGNLLFNIFLPVFFAGLMLGCRDQEQGNSFGVGHLFAGFSGNLGQYVLLGVFYLVGIVVIIILMLILMILMMGGSEFLSNLQAGQMEDLIANYMSFVLALLIGLFFYLPILMAFWFAPVLIAMENMTAIDAMKASFKGCLVNVVPYLIYGLVGLVFSFIATLLFGLGWLVLFPMITISIYLAYRDIFKQGSADE